jgi:hypothetical protein
MRLGRWPAGREDEIRLVAVGQIHLLELVHPLQPVLNLLRDGAQIFRGEPRAVLRPNHLGQRFGERTRLRNRARRQRRLPLGQANRLWTRADQRCQYSQGDRLGERAAGKVCQVTPSRRSPPVILPWRWYRYASRRKTSPRMKTEPTR